MTREELTAKIEEADQVAIHLRTLLEPLAVRLGELREKYDGADYSTVTDDGEYAELNELFARVGGLYEMGGGLCEEFDE